MVFAHDLRIALATWSYTEAARYEGQEAWADDEEFNVYMNLMENELLVHLKEEDGWVLAQRINPAIIWAEPEIGWVPGPFLAQINVDVVKIRKEQQVQTDEVEKVDMPDPCRSHQAPELRGYNGAFFQASLLRIASMMCTFQQHVVKPVLKIQHNGWALYVAVVLEFLCERARALHMSVGELHVTCCEVSDFHGILNCALHKGHQENIKRE